MAALRSLALASPISHCWHPQSRSPSLSGIVTWAVHGSAQSPFNGQSVHMPRMRLSPVTRNSKVSGPITMAVKPTIQFIQGTDELTVPDVKLTKSRDGSNGMAIFSFSEPSVFDSSGEIGDITGFYMIDEEGTLQSVDVSAKFVNGRPSRIEAKYIMRSPREWDRFMRFMERQMVKALLDSHLSLMQKPLCSLLFNIFLLLLLMFDFLPFIMYMQGDGPCS